MTGISKIIHCHSNFIEIRLKVIMYTRGDCSQQIIMINTKKRLLFVVHRFFGFGSIGGREVDLPFLQTLPVRFFLPFSDSFDFTSCVNFGR